MPLLACKTKNQKRTKDESKIYFCCSPKDFEKYFERISNDIWSIKNVSIFHDENVESGEYNKEWYTRLSSMQMFVGIITSSFFENDCRAREEFKFAIDNGIPVVPIFAEFGIERIFDEKFENLHGISLYSLKSKEVENSNKNVFGQNGRDINDYKNILKKRIENLLLGEELLKKIREEKYVYIFVSYRKKDFQKAIEYMQCIHDIEGCDEVAFWFDDYLIPGENFENAIENKLKESNAVGLVVTPSLLELNAENQKNYVAQIEYPMAKEEDKMILPIEMIKTNLEQLQGQFDGLDRVYLTTDKEEIEHLVKNIMEEEIRGTSEHDFLIGMAYLKGIDREINKEKAVKKIKEAAQAHNREAMKQLVSMLRQGDGVKVNDKINGKGPLEWQKELVNNIMDDYGPIVNKNKKRKEHRMELFEELCTQKMELANLYEENDKKEEALAEYNLVMEICKNADVNKGKFTLTTARFCVTAASSYIKLKKASISHVGEAEVLINRFNKIEEAIAKVLLKEGNDEDKRKVYMLRVEIADLRVMIGEEKQMFHKYGEIYEGLEKLNVSDAPDAYYDDLCYVLWKQGEVLVMLGKIDMAISIYEKVIKLNQKWVEESESDDAKTSLSIQYEKMGDFYRDRFGNKKLEVIEKYIKKSVEISEEFTKDEAKNSVGRQTDLAAGYRRLAEIKEILAGNELKFEGFKKYRQEAYELYQKALDIHKAAYEKHNDSETYRLLLAESYTDFGDFYCELAVLANRNEEVREEFSEIDVYFKEAEDNYLMGKELAEQVKMTYENAYRRQHGICRYYQRMAILYKEIKKDMKTAKELAENGLKEVYVKFLKDDEEYIKMGGQIKKFIEELKTV